MAEATRQYLYRHPDLVKVLMQDQGIHEGLWQLLVNFGFGATNIGAGSPESPGDVNPAAIVPVLGVGLQEVTEMGPLVFDAAKVNPVGPPASKISPHARRAQQVDKEKRR